MKHRGMIPSREREARSRLAKIVHSYPFIKGSIVLMRNTCGKPNCRCMREGKKHISLYLSVRYRGARKMIHIPKELEGQVKLCVKAYKDILSLMEVISESTLMRLKGGK